MSGWGCILDTKQMQSLDPCFHPPVGERAGGRQGESRGVQETSMREGQDQERQESQIQGTDSVS